MFSVLTCAESSQLVQEVGTAVAVRPKLVRQGTFTKDDEAKASTASATTTSKQVGSLLHF